MASTLEDLISKLSLTAEENEVVVAEGEAGLMEDLDPQLCIMGLLCSPRSIHGDVLKKVLMMLWKVQGCEVRVLSTNKFLFAFESKVDKEYVLEGEPWCFDNHLLALREIDTMSQMSKLKFEDVSIWVQFHDLPLACMSREIGERIGACMGTVLEVDTDASGRAWGEYLRVRVRLNFRKPLRRVIKMALHGQIITAGLKYERLPTFCYACGRIGHSEKACEFIHYDACRQNVTFSYGAWLRVNPDKRNSNHNSKEANGRGTGMWNTRNREAGERGAAEKGGYMWTSGNSQPDEDEDERRDWDARVVASEKGKEVVAVSEVESGVPSPYEGLRNVFGSDEGEGTGGIITNVGTKENCEDKGRTWKRRARARMIAVGDPTWVTGEVG